VRRRIVLFAAGTALLAVVLLAVPLGVLAGRSYLRDERLELQQAAATAAAQARGDIATSPIAPRVDGREITISVYDRGGRRVSGLGPARAGDLVRAALHGRQASNTTSQTIAVAAPVSDGDHVIASLLLTTNLAAVRRSTWHAWLGLAGLCAAAVVVSAFGAWLLARRLTRPVDRLTTVAARVGAGDLTARVAPSGVAELDALADTLNKTVVQVETMIQRERAFSTEVSHQLRTPLSGLRLDLEAAHAGLPTPAQRDSATRTDEGVGVDATGVIDHLSRALLAVDVLEATVTDVIRLARDLPAAERCELNALLDTVTTRWRGRFADASRPLRVLTDAEAPDAIRLSAAASNQILDILMDNAYRHGRGAVTIRVRAMTVDGNDDTHDTVAVEISDEGPPLTVEAWQLFRRTAPPDGSTGHTQHGIGLPYARRLAQAEGARLVLAHSTPPTFALITDAWQ
jgi:signal transduction histidine kinase